MNWDWPSISVALIFSAVGFVYVSYGRRQAAVGFLLSGVALMGYSYFVDSWLWAMVIGIALTLAPFVPRLFYG